MSGVEAFSAAAVIGGTTASARNVISGNAANGLRIGIGNTVQGNFIGTDVTGTAALGNGESGIAVLGSANVIGGSVTGARNVISANAEHGLSFEFPEGAHDNVVQGNLIGTKADGTGDLGNAVQGIRTPRPRQRDRRRGRGRERHLGQRRERHPDRLGVRRREPGHRERDPRQRPRRDQGRVRAQTAWSATSSSATGRRASGSRRARRGTPIKSNQIFGNGGLGIDLSGGTQDGAGVTANDTDDPDTGANGLQNFPVLSSAMRACERRERR